MKLTDFIELYNLLNSISNEGNQILDFGIDNKSGELWVTLKDGTVFTFTAKLKS